MVKIVVAGGSGELAREVLDALVAASKHEITILSRKDVSSENVLLGIAWKTVDYANKGDLAESLRGIYTVLSFVNQTIPDQNGSSQKSLIDACVTDGVKRFAPSEYGCNDISDLPFWAGKREIREYLKKVNENGKILEYTLFHPGVFMDYLASPNKTAKYVTPLDTFIDFENHRAIGVEGYEDAMMNYTSVKDIAGIVAASVKLADGKWPEIGGIRGSRITVSQLLEMAARVRGHPFTIDKVKLEDLQAGFTDAQAEQLAAVIKTVMTGTLLACAKGAWDSPDTFNKLLPDYSFTPIETFLSEVWGEKPQSCAWVRLG